MFFNMSWSGLQIYWLTSERCVSKI